MEKLLPFLLARLKEPSSWAALGGLLVTVGVLNPGAYQKYIVIVGGILGIFGFAMPENSAAPVPQATNPPEQNEKTAQ